MTKFIENVNTFISQLKIKQTYISEISGIDTKKLSRILTGVQDASSADMEKIAQALGKTPEFFWGESFFAPVILNFMPEKVEFYAGDPTKAQEEMADKLVQLMENIDKVLSAKWVLKRIDLEEYL
ncbi:MAG: helix-turn-helix transcriptional regulator [Lachnospiraceae bacterium]|nr:helix-turn-helix transcriptional regulator [Lachnospiraceae bacterium]